MYGHLLFSGLRELVRPVYSGFPGTPNADDWPSNLDSANNARRQGAIAMYAHPAVKLEAFPSGSDARESVVDVALGGIDALEVFCSQEEAAMRLWYHFLNCGFPLGISGGSDAFLNQNFAFVAGGDRVYVQAGRGFSHAEWIDGLRARPCVCRPLGPFCSSKCRIARRASDSASITVRFIFRFPFALFRSFRCRGSKLWQTERCSSLRAVGLTRMN